MKLPIPLQEGLLDTMKAAQLDPRQYPVIHIHWNGSGDSGGIEDIHALTHIGKEKVIKYGCLPNYGQSEDVAITVITRQGAPIPSTYNAQVNLNTSRRDPQYALDQWVYKNFDLCEINEGGYGNIYVDLGTRKVWGTSYNWVTEDIENVSVEYED